MRSNLKEAILQGLSDNPSESVGAGDKLRELILYIAQRSANDPSFGRTKLAKLLFWADFEAYAELGESITGARYRKAPHGPMPGEFSRTIERELDLDASAIAALDQPGDW